MRLTLSIAVAALVVATPAVAQNETTPTNVDVTANAIITNETTNVAPGTPTNAAATPGTQTAPLPPDANTAAVDTAVTRERRREGHGFPWGVLGLLGLIGLLGRKRSTG